MSQEKRSVIQLRLEKEIKEDFEEYCKSIGATMSNELKRYIVSRVKENKTTELTEPFRRVQK